MAQGCLGVGLSIAGRGLLCRLASREGLCDGPGDLGTHRILLRLETRDGLPCPVDQELVKVPAQRSAEFRVFPLVGEKGIEGMLPFPLAMQLAKDSKANAFLGTELLDLVVRARLLGAEIIARKSQDLETALVELTVE